MVVAFATKRTDEFPYYVAKTKSLFFAKQKKALQGEFG